MKMKRLPQITLMLLAVFAAFTSCKKDEDFQGIESTEFRINYPDGFSSSARFEGEVTLKDRNSGTIYTTEAKDGIATFTYIMQGVYDLSVSKTLTAAQFKELAPGLGDDLKNEVVLSGLSLSVNLLTDEDAAKTHEVTLNWAVKGSLVISKIYSNGTKTTAGKTFLNDRYWEIFNNSSETVYLDGLCLAYLWGNTNTAAVTNPFYEQYKDAVFVNTAARFPGSGSEHPLAPGESVVVAQSAANFVTEERPMDIDLTGADFETYYADSDMSQDNTAVPNMEIVYKAIAGARVFGMATMSVILFRATDAEIASMEKLPEPGSSSSNVFLKIPNGIIIDAVQQYKAEDANPVMHAELDASAAVLGREVPVIAERKVAYTATDGRKVLQDTNNSGADFVVSTSVDGTPAFLVPRQYDKPVLNK